MRFFVAAVVCLLMAGSVKAGGYGAFFVQQPVVVQQHIVAQPVFVPQPVFVQQYAVQPIYAQPTFGRVLASRHAFGVRHGFINTGRGVFVRRGLLGRRSVVVGF